jgi:hypothetical protein
MVGTGGGQIAHRLPQHAAELVARPERVVVLVAQLGRVHAEGEAS